MKSFHFMRENWKLLLQKTTVILLLDWWIFKLLLISWYTSLISRADCKWKNICFNQRKNLDDFLSFLLTDIVFVSFVEYFKFITGSDLIEKQENLKKVVVNVSNVPAIRGWLNYLSTTHRTLNKTNLIRSALFKAHFIRKLICNMFGLLNMT